MKKPIRPTAKTRTVPADFGAQLHAIKEDLSAMMSLLQAKWGEIRKDAHPGETVSELVKKSGLDQTWNGLKQAAVSTVQPWLPSAPVKRAKKRAVRTVKKAVTTAKKAAATAAKKVKATTRVTVSKKRR